MPYKSKAQMRKFHMMEEAGQMDTAMVREFDRASKGKKLPERVKPKKRKPRSLKEALS